MQIQRSGAESAEISAEIKAEKTEEEISGSAGFAPALVVRGEAEGAEKSIANAGTNSTGRY